jgi:hypothetical protein
VSALDLEDAKVFLKITGNDDDTEIQSVIDAAEAALGHLIGPLSSTAVTERVFGGSGALVLSTLPVISLTSVTPYGGSALTLSDLTLTSSGTVEYVNGGAFGRGAYTVVYQAGRASLAADLLQADRELVRHLWATQRGSSNTRPRPAGDLSNTLPGAAYTFPIRVEQLIAPYRLFGFA